MFTSFITWTNDTSVVDEVCDGTPKLLLCLVEESGDISGSRHVCTDGCSDTSSSLDLLDHGVGSVSV